MTAHTTAADPATRVTIPFTEYRTLTLDAAAWRLLAASPHVAELLAEWVEWDRRRTLRETSHAVSAAADWRALASAPTYAELERRRAIATRPTLTPHQIRAQTAASWARVDAWIATREAA
ncbi:hypothetical protein [Amycolatopsis rifamycinica]|uniref:Uncharacterized protein n=1 Tax=Amycolatopsis rifamycinica TaxID=287986 RepID=A0A066U8Y5_9PSEU|nr:hypothetical protein [Amycolatopsis rifamycinica]KDN23931.1 hypothetical protein DV20_02405 [Amycolatopsis rifamycinica]